MMTEREIGLDGWADSYYMKPYFIKRW